MANATKITWCDVKISNYGLIKKRNQQERREETEKRRIKIKTEDNQPSNAQRHVVLN